LGSSTSTALGAEYEYEGDGGIEARSGDLRTLFRVRDSIGMWTPGGPRASANPGLSASTPPAWLSGLET